MNRCLSVLLERVFRGPRLWSNSELRKTAPLFSGSVVNVSGWRDLDKSVPNYREYLFGDCNEGVPYRSYFTNAKSYTVTNHPKDAKIGDAENLLDLEDTLPEAYRGRFDVAFSHTVLEHVFHVFKAFENLCAMSRDVVILIVPFAQLVHDYRSGYKDYWRFTPFALDELFSRHGFTVLYRASNRSFQSSIYFFYVASRKPEKWRPLFHAKDLEHDLTHLNLGQNMFPLAAVHLRIEEALRRIFSRMKKGMVDGSR